MGDPLDPQRLALLESLGRDRDVLSEILEAYIRSVTRQRELLVAGFEIGELEQVAMAAHSLEGSSANMGAHRVANAARAVQARAREGATAAAKAAYSDLLDSLGEALEAIEALLAGRR